MDLCCQAITSASYETSLLLTYTVMVEGQSQKWISQLDPQSFVSV